MNGVYYAELNLTCIIILILFKRVLRYKANRYSAANIAFSRLILVSIFFCAMDIITGMFKGSTFAFSRTVLEIANVLYYESLVTIGYLWSIYVHIRIESTSEHIERPDRRRMRRAMLPLILFTLLAASNPFTHILFDIDADNFFVRNIGTYIHWFTTWMYLVVATVATLKAMAKEKNKVKRQEIMPLLYFTIAPIIASVLQMCFYGVTSVQVGLTISIVMMCLNEQNRHILSDELTGLNNRRAFDNFINYHVSHNSKSELTLIMIDVNRFKLLNDRFGHITGDAALRDTGEALKQACRSMLPERPFLCRYGGDEFVIAGIFKSEAELRLCESIPAQLNAVTKENGRAYGLTVSIGVAKGMCASADDIESLLNVADERMYDYKKREYAK